jgi:hypothetical protein
MKFFRFIEIVIGLLFWPILFPWNTTKSIVMISEGEEKSSEQKVTGGQSPLWPVVGIFFGMLATHILDNAPIPMYYTYFLYGLHFLGLVVYFVLNGAINQDMTKKYGLLNILLGLLWGSFAYLLIIIMAPAKG